MAASILEEIRSLDFGNSELWIREAEFGYRYISEYCRRLPKHGSVLEIGCGSGLLLSMLCDAHGHLDLEGIEPFGTGFASLENLNRAVVERGVAIRNVGYEQFEPESGYDLVYCVNVLEHLADWRAFIDRVGCWLKPGGVLLILCPNYGFPYESHFRIPIIYNKPLTYWLFSRRIRAIEAETGLKGQWDSLNFVRKKEIFAYVDALPALEVTDHVSITEELVARFATDPEFRKRQRFVGSLGSILQLTGLLQVMKRFPGFLPYMMLEIRNRV